MRKKVSIAFSWLLVVCILMAQTITVHAENIGTNLFAYEDYGEEGIVITGYNGDKNTLTDLTIPAEIDGKSVVGVNGAFKDFTALKSVTVPQGIGSIGDNTFYGCTGLESVKLSKGLNYIGGYAFADCTSLESIELPEGLREIGVEAFSGCKALKSINIPDSLTLISGGVFYDCTALKDITIPSSVMKIEYNALGYYYAAETDEVKPVEGFKITGYKNSAAYDYAREFGFPFVSLGETTPFAYVVDADSGDTLNIIDYYGEKDEVTELVVPSEINGKKVTAIGSGALSGFNNVSSVTLPEDIYTIEDMAFIDCPSLFEVTIPKNVYYIGEYAFGYRNAVVSEEESEKIKTYDFKIMGYKNSKAEVYARENGFEFVSLGEVSPFMYSKEDNGTICIMDYNGDKSQLTSLEIPSEIDGKKVKEIGYGAFSGCTNLENLTIPDSVERIDYTAFSDCGNLKQVTIPRSVKFIEQYAFGYCYDPLEEEDDVFKKVSGFKITGYTNSAAYAYARDNGFEFVSLGEVSPFCCSTHDNGDVYISAYYGDKSSLEYLNIPKEIGGKTIYGIDVEVFKSCERLKSVVLPESVSVIEYGAFSDCPNLTSISLDDGLNLIEAKAFYNCPQLKEVYLPGTLIEVGEYSFGYYVDGEVERKVEGFTINGYTHSYGHEYAMENGFNFVSIDAVSQFKYYQNEDGTITIYDYIEDDKETIDGIAIPDIIDGMLVTGIECAAFAELPNLKFVVVPESVTQIYDYAFGYYLDKSVWDYVKIENFTIYGYYGSAAEKYALENDFEYVSLNLGDYPYIYFDNQDGTAVLMEYIGSDAATVTDIIIPRELDGNKIVGIKGNLFENCPNLKSVAIPGDIKEISGMGLGYYYNNETMEFTKIDGFTIYGDRGTAAEEYALENGFDFVDLEGGLNFLYYEKDDGTIEIVGYWGDDNIAELIIPRYIDGKRTVTSIGESAFTVCPKLRSVTIPAEIESIGQHALGYYIDDNYDWAKKDGFTIYGEQGTAAEEYAIENGFKFVSVDNNFNMRYCDNEDGTVTIIGYCGDDSLTVPYLTIPNEIGNKKVVSIDKYAFENCRNLKYVAVPDTVKNIEEQALGYYYDFDTSELVKIDGFTICSYPGSAAESYAKENGFNFIGIIQDDNYVYFEYEDGKVCILAYCGDDMATIEELTIPNTMADGKLLGSIGEYAFANCGNLKKVNVPDTIEHIADYALGYYISEDGTTVKKDDFTIYGKQGTAAEEYALQKGFDFIDLEGGLNFLYYEKDDGTIEIVGYWGDDNIAELIIPRYIDGKRTVTSIGESAFTVCPKLRSVTIPAEIESIGQHALGYYIDDNYDWAKKDGFTIYGEQGTAAEEYAIENGFKFVSVDNNFNMRYCDNEDGTVTIIGYCGDDSLTVPYLTIPNEIGNKKVVSIDKYAFENCRNLKYVAVPDTVKNIEEQALGYYYDFDTSELVKIDGFTICSYPGSAAESYAKENGFNFIGIIQDDNYVYFEYEDGKVCILAYCGDDMATIEELTIPNTMADGKLLGSIGEYAFANCGNLKKVNVPDTIEHIADYALGYYISEDGTTVKKDDFTIYGKQGTAAEEYALENGFNFVDTNENPINPDEPSEPSTDPTNPDNPSDPSTDVSTDNNGGTSNKPTNTDNSNTDVSGNNGSLSPSTTTTTTTTTTTAAPGGTNIETVGTVGTGDGTLMICIVYGSMLMLAAGLIVIAMRKKRFNK